jgi:hypothetical protein
MIDNRNRWKQSRQQRDYLFYSHGENMPDLNYDSAKLREEMFKVGKFWLTDIGVDGFRPDAKARHIFFLLMTARQDNHKWWLIISSVKCRKPIRKRIWLARFGRPLTSWCLHERTPAQLDMGFTQKP